MRKTADLSAFAIPRKRGARPIEIDATVTFFGAAGVVARQHRPLRRSRKARGLTRRVLHLFQPLFLPARCWGFLYDGALPNTVRADGRYHGEAG